MHLADEFHRYRFLLAVSEMMSNAVCHGGGSGRQRIWCTGGALLARISDHGRGIAGGTGPTEPRAGPGAGRGLWLAREVRAGVHVSTSPAGTSVLLRYLLPPG
ncbi:ATP-binding protein [Actinoplanes sp. NPDC049681]|uniref:ATP-binding protein n=1 Tax=Actinoplanes sp. NPDC049681 TaxID=3363905 RepID=UPI0037897198